MTTSMQMLRAEMGIEIPFPNDLSLSQVRVAVGQLLVIVSFVWPFFNDSLLFTGYNAEINFVPVFIAAFLLPEILFSNPRSILLSIPAFAVALIWGGGTAWLRLAIGIVPLHFIINLTRYLRQRGRYLIPPDLSYRAFRHSSRFAYRSWEVQTNCTDYKMGDQSTHTFRG